MPHLSRVDHLADNVEVRAYMHKTILMLVEAHAKVGDIVPSTATGLVNRVLIALVTKVTEVALRCFQQVPKYGTGGMLTVSDFISHFYAESHSCHSHTHDTPSTWYSVS
jgi:exocyst complex component 2